MITEDEDYVSFEIAELLKDKGFDWGCRACYGSAGSFCYKKYEIEASECEIHNYLLAPTQQMAMKWLREKYEVFISIGCCTYPKLKKVTYIPEITTFDSVFGDVSIEYDSHEEACETAIKYCLENLI